MGDCILGLNSRRFTEDDELEDVAGMLRSTPRPMMLTVRKLEKRTAQKGRENDLRSATKYSSEPGSRERRRSRQSSHGSSASRDSRGSADEAEGNGEFGYDHYQDDRGDFDEEEAWKSRVQVEREGRRREERERSVSPENRQRPSYFSLEERKALMRSASAGRERAGVWGHSKGGRSRSSHRGSKDEGPGSEGSTSRKGSFSEVEEEGTFPEFSRPSDQQKTHAAANTWFKLSVAERFSRQKKIEGEGSENGAAMPVTKARNEKTREDGLANKDVKKKRKSVVSKALKLTGLKPSRDSHHKQHQESSGPGSKFVRVSKKLTLLHQRHFFEFV